VLVLALVVSGIVVAAPAALAGPVPAGGRSSLAAAGFADLGDLLSHPFGRPPAYSTDLRWMAVSTDQALLPADTDAGRDVYLFDRVSLTKDLVAGELMSTPGPDPDIRVVGVADGGRFVWVHSGVSLVRVDRQTSTEHLAGLLPGGAGAPIDTYSSTVSADGNRVLYDTAADGLVPDDANGKGDAFVEDVAAGTISRVSVGNSGNSLTGTSHAGVLSADGRFATFLTSDYSLGGYPSPRSVAINVTTGARTMIPRQAAGAYVDGVDPSGRYYVVRTGGTTDEVRRWDRVTGAVVTFEIPGSISVGSCARCVSADGRFLALVTDRGDIFRVDASTGVIEGISAPYDGGPEIRTSGQLSMVSRLGGRVAFGSGRAGILPGVFSKGLGYLRPLVWDASVVPVPVVPTTLSFVLDGAEHGEVRAGQQVGLTVRVASPSGTPTGSVLVERVEYELVDGVVELDLPVPWGQGSFLWTPAFRYLGAEGWGRSEKVLWAHVVPSVPETTLEAETPTIVSGGVARLVASVGPFGVRSAGLPPVGTIKLYKLTNVGSAKLMGTVDLGAGGVPVFDVHGLAIGTHRFFARYSGPFNLYSPADSPSVQVVVSPPVP